MDQKLKIEFEEKWKRYFGDTALPITFYFGDDQGTAEKVVPVKRWNCLIGDLARVRNGENLSFNDKALTCGGAKRYLGYAPGMRPDFEYFLSCGIPGKMEGERYIRTPELVREIMKNQQTLPNEGKNIVFKRWDKLTESDHPEVVIFFATADVLSGLFTLANFDSADRDSSMAPFAAGCGSIVHYPWLERSREKPRAVIGMFDPSARPYVPAGMLSFAVPMNKFEKMISCMDESFLITETWEKVRNRISMGKELPK
jgi:hypothetical protein